MELNIKDYIIFGIYSILYFSKVFNNGDILIDIILYIPLLIFIIYPSYYSNKDLEHSYLIYLIFALNLISTPLHIVLSSITYYNLINYLAYRYYPAFIFLVILVPILLKVPFSVLILILYKFFDLRSFLILEYLIIMALNLITNYLIEKNGS